MLLGIIFGLLFGWPFIERKLTNDNVTHNLLQLPRDAPTRTSLGPWQSPSTSSSPLPATTSSR